MVSISAMSSSLFADGNKMKVIVDTDCDMDDMMAILFLLKRKDVQIVAITTTGTGMARWKYTAPNILNLLQLSGNTNIPVSYGAKNSLSPYSNFPDSWRKQIDEVYNIKLPKNLIPASPLTSAELIVKLLNETEEKITILGLAPLTNIALALNSNPTIADKVEQIVISGGAVNIAGNIVGKAHGYVNTCAEYNIFLDAKAAEVVFSSNIPTVLCPLNATQMAPITQETCAPLNKDQKNPSEGFVANVVEPFLHSQDGSNLYFWDPVAAAVMVKPSIGKFQTINMSVIQTPGTTYGCTSPDDNGYPIKVCMSIDPKAFYRVFFNTLSKGD